MMVVADRRCFNLDGLGNWASFTEGATTTDRTHNAANELTGIDGATVDPTYDAAGNMTSGPTPGAPTARQHYVWDAWNRLIYVQEDDGTGDPGATLAEFKYDGRNFRIQKNDTFSTFDYYQNEADQIVEVRQDGDVDPRETYVWDPRYIDAPVVRFLDANTDGDTADAGDSALYYTTDANMNVTALVDAATGEVVERYAYTPYGEVEYYEENWTPLTASAFANTTLYTGRLLDTESGLYYYRARYYDAGLGRFVGRDPIGSVSPSYAYVDSSPIELLDPLGLVPVTVTDNHGTTLLLDSVADEGTFVRSYKRVEQTGFRRSEYKLIATGSHRGWRSDGEDPSCCYGSISYYKKFQRLNLVETVHEYEFENWPFVHYYAVMSEQLETIARLKMVAESVFASADLLLNGYALPVGGVGIIRREIPNDIYDVITTIMGGFLNGSEGQEELRAKNRQIYEALLARSREYRMWSKEARGPGGYTMLRGEHFAAHEDVWAEDRPTQFKSWSGKVPASWCAAGNVGKPPGFELDLEEVDRTGTVN